jgi:phage FluMu gp28-like protein
MGTDAPPLIGFRSYQARVFKDRSTGVLILHWSRQIGKSYTLAAWAVDRILSKLPKHGSWLVTVLSNSRDNGGEFAIKAQEVCNKLGIAMEAVDESPDLEYENMRFEVRIKMTVNGQTRIGRIKVLAANPRTARGFSGDLILDEFAFHEDSAAIWEAAEPILSSNAEFLCRIASTGNGKFNMFYRMSAGDGPSDGTPFLSRAGFAVSRVTRTEAHRMGVKVYDPNTRQPITPEEARKKALDKAAYDQNYECQFRDENMALLTHNLISAAERSLITIDEQEWSQASLSRMYRAHGSLFVGNDIGRTRDLSSVPVLEVEGRSKRVIAWLKMSAMRLPAQRRQLEIVCKMPRFRKYCGDMTGLGTGLVEELQEKFGTWRIEGVNFASTERVSARIMAEGRKAETARVTEIMATNLLGEFEDRTIEIPNDPELRDDLRKPEKVVSPGGRVSIAATRDEAGHADHFWGLALAVRASGHSSGPFVFKAIDLPGRNLAGLRSRRMGGAIG